MPMADQRAELVPLLKIVVLRYSYNSLFPVEGKGKGEQIVERSQAI